ncbi:MAG TPA: hypothetical protein ENN09_06460 [Planctomycetes bacterium]|nr:hypothetical protein [Planctomycetota bacterium]
MACVAVYKGSKNISGEKAAAALSALEIPFRMVGVRDIAAGRLEDFSCVVFPGGHSVQIGAGAEKRLLGFLDGGGGFVGICAGALHGAIPTGGA